VRSSGLRVGRVDVEACTVAVVETIVRGRRGSVGVGEPKSDAGRRTVALPASLAAMLAAHMHAAGLTEDDRNALLFTVPSGSALRYTNWLRRVVPGDDLGGARPNGGGRSDRAAPVRGLGLP
jgi:hypothetical protein